MNNFTHTPIKGIMPKHFLPKGIGLVLEGGGTRGFYSAGVFEAFMEMDIMFPYIIGVSAGAANALSYVSGQKGRNRQIVEHYVGRHEYVSRRNLIKHGSLFGYDFIFKTVPDKHIFWDREHFEKVDIQFITGVTSCLTGKAEWFGKNENKIGFEITRASCSVPMISKIVKYNGTPYLDGGTSIPIPIEKSIEDGNKFHVIVLTQNKGFIKPPFGHKNLVKFFYRKYPALAETLLNRHEVYNRQVEFCEKLEKEGKAIIIRPLKPLTADRATADTQKLLALHDEGHEEGLEAIKRIKEYL